MTDILIFNINFFSLPIPDFRSIDKFWYENIVIINFIINRNISNQFGIGKNL